MRRCNHSALATSVEDAWNHYLDPKAFVNVFGRLRVVLRCILDDNGGNSKVESKRGILFRDATIIDLTQDEQENDQNQNAVIELDYDSDDIDSVTSL